MRMNGFSDVIGSWKIMAMRRPRTARISSAARSAATGRRGDLAEAIRPGGDGTSRMIDRLVTDLPDPDSPTMPSVFAASQLEADTVHRSHHAAVFVEVGAQVAYAQQRLVAVGPARLTHDFLICDRVHRGCRRR
jgi:hypothetical protein